MSDAAVTTPASDAEMPPAHARGRARGLDALLVIASDIKLAHSVFALPFALFGAFLAATSPGGPLQTTPTAPVRFSWQVVLILVAMVSARTVAMLANRIADRKIDATNPRTSGRAIPSGRLSAGTAVVAMLVSAAVFIGACAAFIPLDGNQWPIRLALPVLLWLWAYGYTKRFTWLCHLWLGVSLGISPIAAALAVQPTSLGDLAPWLLGAAVTCWVAGFDVIYALQDVEVDRRDGLSSMPASLGEVRAMHASRVLHVASVGLLVGVYLLDPSRALGRIYVGAVAIAAVVLLIEHLTVKRWGTTRMALTFATLNGIVSVVVGGAGIADLVAG